MNIWNQLPRLTVEQIEENSDLTQSDIKPSQLEFKTCVKVDGILGTGYFEKGTQELVIGRYEHLSISLFSSTDEFEEGMFKKDNLRGYGRKIYGHG